MAGDHVPFMVMAATLDKISKPVNPYVFTTTMPGSGDGTTLARFIESMPNVKRVAIVKNANEWADTKTAPLLAALKGKVDDVDTEQIEHNASEATQQALRVKEHPTDHTVVIDQRKPVQEGTRGLFRSANPYVFTTTMPGSGDGTTLARFIESMPNVKRVAIVKNANEWADTKTAPLLAALKGKVDVVDTEQINNNASDATAQVLRVKEHHPDATVVIAYPAETAVFLRDAHKYGLDGPFLATSSVMDMLDLAKRAGGLDAVQNVYVAS